MALDPRQANVGLGTRAGVQAVDVGLRAYMLKVYNYMGVGLLLTAASIAAPATTGDVSIVKSASGASLIVLGENFRFDGAPDPRVGLGTNGRYDKSSDAGELGSGKGSQSYAVPGNVDVSKYNEVYIWCRKFNVPLGVATLK